MIASRSSALPWNGAWASAAMSGLTGPRVLRSPDVVAGGERALCHAARVERATVDVYERRAVDWQAARPPRSVDDARALAARAARAGVGGPCLDAGSGPGSYLAALRRPTVAIDAARAMLTLGR